MAHKLEDVSKEIALAESRILFWNKHLTELKKERAEICPHDTVIERVKYTPGDYYNRSFWEYQGVCQCCDKIVAQRSVTGSYG